MQGLKENAWKASLARFPAGKAPGAEVVTTRCSQLTGSPGLSPAGAPAAFFSGTYDSPVRVRPALRDLLACLGRGLEKSEVRKEVVEGKEREEAEGQEASEAELGRSRAGFLRPRQRAPRARGGGCGAGVVRGGQWRAAQRRGRCRNTRRLTAKLPNSALIPEGSLSQTGRGRGRWSRFASEHGSRMRRLASGRGRCRRRHRHRRAAAGDPRPAPFERRV